jgi:hypothetical protein
VGPFIFGSSIENYFELELQKMKLDLLGVDGFDSATYHIPDLGDKLDIITLDGLIYHIITDKYLYYRKKNLIGRMFTDTKSILGRKTYDKRIYEECTDEYIYYFNEEGIDLWVKKGIVVSATCYASS